MYLIPKIYLHLKFIMGLKSASDMKILEYVLQMRIAIDLHREDGQLRNHLHEGYGKGKWIGICMGRTSKNVSKKSKIMHI